MFAVQGAREDVATVGGVADARSGDDNKNNYSQDKQNTHKGKDWLSVAMIVFTHMPALAGFHIRIKPS